MEELFEIGDRVTVLRDGRSVGTYDVRGMNKSELIRLMVNRELTELVSERESRERPRGFAGRRVKHEGRFERYQLHTS